MDINYPALEPGNEFWNWVRVPGSCYISLITIGQNRWRQRQKHL